ncbi:MAG: nucleotide 5'-monophosphate nucleosidase PpnN [Succinivibrionaceae bacterium]
MIAVIQPTGYMSLLSQLEAESISSTSLSDLYDLYRKCSLAVLNTGSITDNSDVLLQKYSDFEINVIQNERGVKLELINPPESAFVNGEIIKNIQNNLYAVLRDIVHTSNYKKNFSRLVIDNKASDKDLNYIRTSLLFSALRFANVFIPGADPNLIVCWGGHAINQVEYNYAYEVGLQLGLRKLDICTGCGPGVMEAPMKGAHIGYAMQDYKDGRFIGLTEPSIIAAEPPNIMINHLVILSDIEQRLEAFVRIASTIIIFPGGPGTAEELLYILSIKSNKANRHEPLPLILTGPEESREYFNALDKFIRAVLGDEVTRLYTIIINDPLKVVEVASKGVKLIKEHRNINSDAYYFNWSLHIPNEIQEHFIVNHESMSNLNLHHNQPLSLLAANLRRAFSGIVAGNVKEYGMKAIKENGPFVLHGDKDIMQALDNLLKDFIVQKRLLISQDEYKPCYKIVL